MKILFCSAEPDEIQCARQAFRVYESKLEGRVQADFLVTGIGSNATCYHLTKKIVEAAERGSGYDLVIDIGIAGSYDLGRFPIGSTALVEREYVGDLGFMTQSGFQSLFDSKTLSANAFPFIDGALKMPELSKMPEPFQRAFSDFKRGVGVTVQSVTGTVEAKERLIKKYAPHIESMEGAAFFYVCLNERVNCAELRSVSNEVGEDDTAKWSTPAALRSLTEACKSLFDKL